ncbi:MAG: acetylornithine deacetylase [Segetibacter sp.]|nr:acetylornithine deacetylase [Segetibacter sp.]
MTVQKIYEDAVGLLKQLIATPSYSKMEDGTAVVIKNFLEVNNVSPTRFLNNVWAVNEFFDSSKPTILLNSHHDTVKPNPQYTKDPFTPIIEDDKLFGLGSNDAGGCLASLIATFLYYYDYPNLKYNLVIAATAEEEISGYNGIEALLGNKEFKQTLNGIEPECAIVGEPTTMNLAIAEKGLMVIDCTAKGKAGHAAREEGENAIYNALDDIEWISTYRFPKQSKWLGPVKMSVTVIETENKAHNMVPSQCKFTIDVRVTELYSHEEVFETIRQNISSEAMPRSMRMRSTGIDTEHPLVKSGLQLGKSCYGSPTCSDKALMPFPALKCGPGDSARSHTADEFIYLNEIKEGINTYIEILKPLLIG